MEGLLLPHTEMTHISEDHPLDREEIPIQILGRLRRTTGAVAPAAGEEVAAGTSILGIVVRLEIIGEARPGETVTWRAEAIDGGLLHRKEVVSLF